MRAKPTLSQLNQSLVGLKAAELKTLCLACGLPISGTKDVLTTRLEQSFLMNHERPRVDPTRRRILSVDMGVKNLAFALMSPGGPLLSAAPLTPAKELAFGGGSPYRQAPRVLLEAWRRVDLSSDPTVQKSEADSWAPRSMATITGDGYERVPDDSPLKRAAELQLGLNLADLKQYDQAIKHLSLLRESDPDDMRAYLALGGVYAAREDYRSAANVYDQAVERLKNPQAGDWNVFYQRGIAYERLKQWPKAEPNFKEALKLYPDHPQVLNYLGYSWIDMNMNLEEGMRLIKRAVELRPSDGYIVDSLGWAYYKLGDYDKAVENLERAVSLQPEDPVLNDHLGDAYWSAGRRYEARYAWRAARVVAEGSDSARLSAKIAQGLPGR